MIFLFRVKERKIGYFIDQDSETTMKDNYYRNLYPSDQDKLYVSLHSYILFLVLCLYA